MRENIGILLIFTLISMSIFGCRNNTVSEYYENGQLKSERNYYKNKAHGKWVFYYESGQVQAEYNYKDGSLDGTSTRYGFDGITQSIEQYSKGKKDGTFIIFSDQGVVIEVLNYKMDSLDGAYRSFFTNGEFKTEGRYSNGSFDSTWVYYDPYNRVIAKGEFVLGNGLVYYYKGTEIIKSEKFNKGKSTGWIYFLDENGSVIDSATVK